MTSRFIGSKLAYKINIIFLLAGFEPRTVTEWSCHKQFKLRSCAMPTIFFSLNLIFKENKRKDKLCQVRCQQKSAAEKLFDVDAVDDDVLKFFFPKKCDTIKNLRPQTYSKKN